MHGRPRSLYLPSCTKLQCTLQLSGQKVYTSRISSLPYTVCTSLYAELLFIEENLATLASPHPGCRTTGLLRIRPCPFNWTSTAAFTQPIIRSALECGYNLLQPPLLSTTLVALKYTCCPLGCSDFDFFSHFEV